MELGNALHEAGCFGKASLKTIFEVLGKTFGCEVKNHYRLFWGKKELFKGEPAEFIEKLKRAYLQKLQKQDR